MNASCLPSGRKGCWMNGFYVSVFRFQLVLTSTVCFIITASLVSDFFSHRPWQLVSPVKGFIVPPLVKYLHNEEFFRNPTPLLTGGKSYVKGT